MTKFLKRHLRDILVHKIRGNIKSATTIQSEYALTWVIGAMGYAVIFIVGASLSGKIPNLYHTLLIYPLATYGIMTGASKIAQLDEDEEKTVNS